MNKYNKSIIYAIIGTITFAVGALFVRKLAYFTNGVSLSFLRMLIASAFILPLYLKKRDCISSQDKWKILFMGIITFIHFYSFILSLFNTSVIRSLSLTYMAPLWTFIISLIYGHEAKGIIKKSVLMVVSIFGILLLLSKGNFELLFSNNFNTGDIQALISGIALSIYHFYGSRLRKRINLFTYVFWVYFISSIPFIFLFGTGFSEFRFSINIESIVLIISVAVFPTVIGHTLINKSLKYVKSPLVSLITTQEITGGVLLTAIFLKDIPGIYEITGAIIIIISISLFYLIDLKEIVISKDL